MFQHHVIRATALAALFTPAALAQVIDFETLPGGMPTVDLQEISTQYAAPPFGVTFRILDRATGAPIGFPRIAKIGAPRTAFAGCSNGADNPAPNAGTCQTLLTDDQSLGASGNLEVTYVTPVPRASAALLDIDVYNGTYEQWTVTAYDVAGGIVDVAVVDSNLATPCGGYPGNGTAVIFTVASPTGASEIASMVLEFTGTAPINNVGLAFDNFSPSEAGLGGPVTGCTAVPNSSGLPALIFASGSPLVVDNQLRVTAQGLASNAPGYFLGSLTTGFVMNPAGSQGNLCLGGAVGRFNRPGEIQNSAACGLFDLTVDLTDMPSPTGSVTALPGDTWTFQCWYRDVNPNPTSNFSDAVSVQLQ